MFRTACSCRLLVITLCLLPTVVLPKTAPEPSLSELRERIEAANDALAQPLSSRAQAARQRSVMRFFEAMNALCGAGSTASNDPEAQSCLRSGYLDYLDQVRESVYRVNGLTVFETNIYGLQWADDDLQEQDPDRSFTWDLRVTWPRVDAREDSSNPLWGPIRYALADEVHAAMGQWVASLWMLKIRVRIKSLSRCYVSATIESSWYSGGAHPNDEIRTFNWNRTANRRLTADDIFRKDSEWRSGMLALYRQHLGKASRELADDDLLPWVDHDYFIDSAGLAIPSHEGRSRADSLPDVIFTWSELAPFLSAAAPCTSS